MKYILDTHAWIWLLDDPDRLSQGAAKAIRESGSMPLGISIISAWEVARKSSLGKLRLSMASRVWLDHATGMEGLSVLPMSPEISWESCNLPGNFHRDPADQIIAATARIHGLSLITCDQRLLEYEHIRSIW